MLTEAKDGPVNALRIPEGRSRTASAAARSRKTSSVVPRGWAINPVAKLDDDEYIDAFEEAAQGDEQFAQALQMAAQERRQLDPKFDLIMQADLAENKWPQSLSVQASVMSHTLQPSMFERLKQRKSVCGWTLARAINSGASFPGGVGIYAADKDCYTGTFRKVFVPIVEACHNGFKWDEGRHDPDQGMSSLGVLTSAAQAKLVFTKLSICCNLSFKQLNPLATKESRVEVEAIMKKVFEQFPEEFDGTYSSHEALSDAERDALMAKHLYFIAGDTSLAAAGINQFWPSGRGVFYNKKKTFAVWVNHSDHLVILSCSNESDVKAAVELLFAGLHLIEMELKGLTGKQEVFLTDARLGSITCCPSNVGTGFSGSVRMLMPRVIASQGLSALEGTARERNCSLRLAGESEVMDCIEVSNARRLGVSVSTLLNDVLAVANQLAQLEEEASQHKRLSSRKSGDASNADVMDVENLIGRLETGARCPGCDTLFPCSGPGTVTCTSCQSKFESREQVSLLECPYCFAWGHAADAVDLQFTCAACLSVCRLPDLEQGGVVSSDPSRAAFSLKREEKGSSFVCGLAFGMALLCAPFMLLHLLAAVLVYLLMFVPIVLASPCQSGSTLQQAKAAGKGSGFDWAQICRRHGIAALYRLTVGECLQWWVNHLFVTNFCMFPRKQLELKYVVRVPQGVNGFQEIVEKACSFGTPSLPDDLQLFITTKARVAALVPDVLGLLLGRITQWTDDSLHVRMSPSSILGPAEFTMAFANENITLTLNVGYSLNPVSYGIIWKTRHILASWVAQLEASIQKDDRSKRHQDSSPVEGLYVPLEQTILPIGFDDAPRKRRCCNRIAFALVYPWIFVGVSCPYLLVGFLWWVLKAVYLFVLLSLTSICWCPAPATNFVQSGQGWRVKSSSVPWGARLDATFWLQSALVWRRGLALCDVYTSWLTGNANIEIIGEETLRRFLTSSYSAHVLDYDAESETVSSGVAKARLDPNGTVTSIDLGARDPTTHSPQDPSWEMAKMHLASSLCARFLRAYCHQSDVLLAQLAASALDARSDFVLHCLLAPHLRFVFYMDSLRGIKASSLPRTEANDEKDENPAWVNVVPVCSQLRSANYDKFLLSYYDVIREFVSRVYPAIKAEKSYPPFMAALGEKLPMVLALNPVDLLTTIIWQVSVVHSAGRFTFAAYSKYVDLSSNNNRREPSSLSIARSRGFAEVFLHSDPRFKLASCDHGFRHYHLRQCEEAFRIALKANDLRLLEHGIRLVPLEHISYCATG